MAMPIHQFLLTVAACCVLLCAAKRDDLYDYTVKELGLTQQLWCNQSKNYAEVVNNSWVVAWMLPDLTVLYVSTERFSIEDSNFSLTVANITHDDLGQYHCMIRYLNDAKNSTEWFLARLGLNAQGPYFEDLWDKYELNTIIGLSSGFGFLAVAIATMLIWQHRYRDPEEENKGCNNEAQPYMAYSDDRNEAKYSNKAFSGADEPSALEANEDEYKKASDGTSQHVESEPSTSGNSDRTEEDAGTAF